MQIIDVKMRVGTGQDVAAESKMKSSNCGGAHEDVESGSDDETGRTNSSSASQKKECSSGNNRQEGLSQPATTPTAADSGGRTKHSTTSKTATTFSASTPRKKRCGMLANLQSDLSPKYIGFRTPPSSVVKEAGASFSDDGTEERTRITRRRNLLGSSADFMNADAAVVLTATSLLGCIRRTRSSNTIVANKATMSSPDRTPPRKPFVSPIDKLLARNGSTASGVVDDTLPRNVLESLNSTATQQPVSIATDLKTDIIDVESMVPSNVVKTLNGHLVQGKQKKLQYELSVDSHEEAQMNALVAKSGDAPADNEIQSAEATSNFANDGMVDSKKFVVDDKAVKNLSNADSNDEKKFSRDAEVRSEDNDDHNSDGNAVVEEPPYAHTPVQMEFETAMTLDVTSSNMSSKSPSAVSLDSAKGSSVVTGMAWMSFSTGDLFWGQIYSYCYWPCMVCPDPDGRSITTERNARHGEEYILVHVRFFADSGRRNWVKRENLTPYTGLENYKQYVREIRDRYGRKNAKYKIMLPKQSQVQTWRDAVKEANMVAEVLYSERLEKFYEIYEHKKSLQKLERKRRQSNPEANNLHGSLNSTMARQKLIAVKRDRSASPFSPTYSPLKAITIKRRRLSDATEQTDEMGPSTSRGSCFGLADVGDGIELLANSSNSLEHSMRTTTEVSSSYSPLQDVKQFHSSDFKRFYSAMKDFVMEHNQDENLERSLIVAVRNIWALKQINHSQMQRRLLESFNENELGSSLMEHGRGEGAVKRLSIRLKSLMMRRSLTMPPASVDEAPPTPPQAPKPQAKGEIAPVAAKPKKVLNRPIEEVIEDIFNLDSKYLFRGLTRDPVCKYCFQASGQLVKCSRGCQTWLHADCIGKANDVATSKKRRSGRRSKLDNNRSIREHTKVVAPTDTVAELSQSAHKEQSVGVVVRHITADEADGAKTAKVVCEECALSKPSVCAVCSRPSDPVLEPLVFCSTPHCAKAFHLACCRYWPQAKVTKSKNKIESFRCPSHVCHTCVSDDPKGKFQHLSSSKLTRCVKCPACYHTDSTCIPAGSQILSAAYIICPRHSSAKSDSHVNVSWCFICVGGGRVLCCETCPTAVHAECLNIAIDPNESYICEECESGRMPLYGEMVWAKFNSFRWWPALILPPTEVPQNIMRKSHNASDFVVRFFGTHDHGWISRRRVYLYLEGDSSEPPRTKSHLDQSYNRGVQEAKRIYEVIKLKKQAQRLSNEDKEKLHPEPYVRIKVNRAVLPVRLHVDLEKVNKCECRPDAEDPCGPDSNCLNRVLYHECNPKLCPAGERCQNQMFESRVSPRLDVVYMKERGFGLVCREPISTGTFVIEYVGEVINDDEFQQRIAQKSTDRDENFYFLSVEKDYIIDAGPKGNMARFMNHSCDPNCETQKWSVNGLNRVGLFAIKDISANTELTFNYHWDDLLGGAKKTCYCGTAKCAGQIGGKFREDKMHKDNHEMEDTGKAKAGKTRKRKSTKRQARTTRSPSNKKQAQLRAAKRGTNKAAAVKTVTDTCEPSTSLIGAAAANVAADAKLIDNANRMPSE